MQISISPVTWGPEGPESAGFRTSLGAEALESALWHVSPGGCELTAL